jgi:hypothetical protein
MSLESLNHGVISRVVEQELAIDGELVHDKSLIYEELPKFPIGLAFLYGINWHIEH